VAKDTNASFINTSSKSLTCNFDIDHACKLISATNLARRPRALAHLPHNSTTDRIKVKFIFFDHAINSLYIREFGAQDSVD